MSKELSVYSDDPTTATVHRIELVESIVYQDVTTGQERVELLRRDRLDECSPEEASGRYDRIREFGWAQSKGGA